MEVDVATAKQREDFIELFRVRLNHIARRLKPALAGGFPDGIGGDGGCGDQLTVLTQGAQSGLARFATHKVKDRIQAITDIVNILDFVVDDVVSTELVKEILVGAGAGGHHMGPVLGGELDGKMPDATGPTQDQHFLVRLQGQMYEQALPCGQRRQGNPANFIQGQPIGARQSSSARTSAFSA